MDYGFLKRENVHKLGDFCRNLDNIDDPMTKTRGSVDIGIRWTLGEKMTNPNYNMIDVFHLQEYKFHELMS